MPRHEKQQIIKTGSLDLLSSPLTLELTDKHTNSQKMATTVKKSRDHRGTYALTCSNYHGILTSPRQVGY